MSKTIQLQKEGENLFPVGAEFGENDNGRWTKFADGTLICEGASGQSGTTTSIHTWTYPMKFISSPRTVSMPVGQAYAWQSTKTETSLTVGLSAARNWCNHIAVGRWK